MAGDLSARDLVKHVWDEVAAERAIRPTPTAGLGDYDRLVADPERHYLNSRYVLARTPLKAADVPGRGVRHKLRARTTRFVVDAFSRYLDEEQEFLAHLVRLQNTLTVHIDRLSGEVRQVEALLQAESDRLRAADTTLHARLEDRIQALEEELAALRRSGGDGQ
jgi:hypothetical protein